MQTSDRKSITSRGLTRWALTAALTALAAFGTLLIRIPIPATTGYFNLGDVFVVWAGLWLGPLAGCIVGAVGPTMSDAIGFPQFILATAVTKGLEGLLIGLIAKTSAKLWVKAAAAAFGTSLIVIGYFVFEAFIYPLLGRSIPFFCSHRLWSSSG